MTRAVGCQAVEVRGTLSPSKSIIKLNKVDHVRRAEAERESRGAPVIRDLVEEAKNAIGMKEARRALESR